jgi:predicted DCC family thiol-disulfide oxidoreductase YuxK
MDTYGHPVVLFDGVCNYCNNVINFIIRQDRKKRLRFAPLQSSAGQELLASHALPRGDFESFVFVYKDRAYQKSTAALQLASLLPWYWQWLQVLRIVPPFLRNLVYDLVARNRYKWFGRKETCMVPGPDIRSRFLS